MKKAALAIMLAILPFTVSAQTVRQGFNPNILIPDAAFSDTQTFGGPEGIQRFLESKNSVLADTSTNFISKLSEPTDPALKARLEDPQPNLGRLRTAAELIWDAARAHGMNPQVILVTMQKEQSLIAPVNQDRLQKALNRAMGFDCPDATGCGNLFPGFYFQLFGNVDTEGNRYFGSIKSLMKSFNTPGGRGPNRVGVPAKVGDTVTIGNTLGGYEEILASQAVTIGNRATAALYRYTPHVFNGNYNFWNFFTQWFKYPNGTLLKSTADSIVYIINDGNLQRVPSFVAVARKLNLNTAMAASPTELAGYPMGSMLGPVDGTIITENGTFAVFMNGIKRPATSYVLVERKLDPANIMQIAPDDSALFKTGAQLTPPDGTILRDPEETTVYRVDNGVLKQFSAFTMKQYGITPKKVTVVPAGEVPLYPKAGFVPPQNGTLIKGPSTSDLYVINESRRLPLTQELFKNNQYKTKDVVTLTTNEEIASIPVGPPAMPRQGTFFAVDKELFIFKDGTKHPIFPVVAKNRGITPDYNFEASVASAWPDGIAIPPKDGALVQGATDPTVYIVVKGQLRPLADGMFKFLKLSTKNILKMADAEVDALAKGVSAKPPENTYFKVKESGEVYVFKSGTKRRIFSFVIKQRGMTPDVTLLADAADDWTNGTPVAPREGTLLKTASSPTVYLVSGTTLRQLTDPAFKRRGYKLKNVLTISKAELDAFPKGALITK
jgi:hypothetical protein